MSASILTTTSEITTQNTSVIGLETTIPATTFASSTDPVYVPTTHSNDSGSEDQIQQPQKPNAEAEEILQRVAEDNETIYALDPLSRKLHVPTSAVIATEALQEAAESRVPSICLLFQKGRCRLGGKCKQLHVEPTIMEQLRDDIFSSTPSCCPAHFKPKPKPGADEADEYMHPLTEKFPEVKQVSVEGVFTMHLDRVCETRACSRKFTTATGDVVTITRKDICRDHAQGSCRFADNCNYMHVCKELMPDLQTKVSIDLGGPTAIERAKMRKQMEHMQRNPQQQQQQQTQAMQGFVPMQQSAGLPLSMMPQMAMFQPQGGGAPTAFQPQMMFMPAQMQQQQPQPQQQQQPTTQNVQQPSVVFFPQPMLPQQQQQQPQTMAMFPQVFPMMMPAMQQQQQPQQPQQQQPQQPQQQQLQPQQQQQQNAFMMQPAFMFPQQQQQQQQPSQNNNQQQQPMMFMMPTQATPQQQQRPH